MKNKFLMVLVFGFGFCTSLNAHTKSEIEKAWNSDAVVNLVGEVVVKHLQMSQIINDANKMSDEDYRKAQNELSESLGESLRKIENCKNLIVSDCAFVRLLDYYLGEANNEASFEAIVYRGKRMIPILKYALSISSTCGLKDSLICTPEKTRREFLQQAIDEIMKEAKEKNPSP
jgi:hypothetical protein